MLVGMADCCFEFIHNKNSNKHRYIKRNEMNESEKKERSILNCLFSYTF